MKQKKFSEKLKEAIENPSEEIPVLIMPRTEKEDIIRVEHKKGYDLVTKKVFWENEKPFEITSAYTPEGFYIGNERKAKFLIEEKGIKPEIAPEIPSKCDSNPNKVCSIGFCEKEQKWYGWSHRAIFGFGIGYVAKKGACVCSSGWTQECLEEHPDWDRSVPVGAEVITLDDAKMFAIAFADSVG